MCNDPDICYTFSHRFLETAYISSISVALHGNEASGFFRSEGSAVLFCESAAYALCVAFVGRFASQVKCNPRRLPLAMRGYKVSHLKSMSATRSLGMRSVLRPM